MHGPSEHNPPTRPLVTIESLEERRLLAWAPTSVAMGLDKLVSQYPTLTGAGQAVAIIDTGVDYNHPALGKGFGGGYKVVGGWDFAANDAYPFGDTNGHGTGLAGVFGANPYDYNGYHNQGVAPGARIVALRAANTTQLKSALDWVAAHRTQYNIVAVNMTDYGGSSALIYKDVLKSLIAAGVFVSHPSGNAGAGVLVSTALDPADFSAGSVDAGGAISSFTQRGPELDMLAPGNHVILPYYDPKIGHIYSDQGNGTSFASPAVVGAAVLVKQIDARFSPLAIMSILQDSGTPVYDSATRRTYKRLNLPAAMALAYQRRGTIVPIPPSSTGTQTPFSGTPITVSNTGPATIQAEDFDVGGEGVSFHDADTANLGGNNYRTGTGVDVGVGGDGVRQVGFTRAGEWLEYTVNLPAAGTFNVSAKVASLGAGGAFHVEVDGADKTGALGVPDTGSWTNWRTVTKAGVALPAGRHVVRLAMNSVGSKGYTGNFDLLTFTPVATTPAAITRSAYAPMAAASYSAQQGTAVAGGNVELIQQGDYLEYKGIDFGSTGSRSFSIGLAVLNTYAGRKIQIRIGSPTGTVIGTVTTAGTGSWTTYKTQTVAVSKVTGVQTVYLTFAGTGYIANLAWFKFA